MKRDDQLQDEADQLDDPEAVLLVVREALADSDPYRPFQLRPRHFIGPAKVNALRALEEAARRHGWTAGVDTDGDPFMGDGAVEFYVCGGFVRTVGVPEDTPAELMALLLEAAR